MRGSGGGGGRKEIAGRQRVGPKKSGKGRGTGKFSHLFGISTYMQTKVYVESLLQLFLKNVPTYVGFPLICT